MKLGNSCLSTEPKQLGVKSITRKQRICRMKPLGLEYQE